MSHFVFPLKKPSMSLEQAFELTIAHCQAGQWQEAETLYHAIVQAQPSPVQGQYWLSYIDALIQSVKPQSAAIIEQPATAAVTLEIPADIKLAKPPNPYYIARQPRWPWKMALGCGHVPNRGESHLLLVRYQSARYEEAEAMARKLTRAFPLYDLGWRVLSAALRKQGREMEALEAQKQRRICCHAVRRRNKQPALSGSPE